MFYRSFETIRLILSETGETNFNHRAMCSMVRPNDHQHERSELVNEAAHQRSLQRMKGIVSSNSPERDDWLLEKIFTEINALSLVCKALHHCVDLWRKIDICHFLQRIDCQWLECNRIIKTITEFVQYHFNDLLSLSWREKVRNPFTLRWKMFSIFDRQSLLQHFLLPLNWWKWLSIIFRR